MNIKTRIALLETLRDKEVDPNCEELRRVIKEILYPQTNNLQDELKLLDLIECSQDTRKMVIDTLTVFENEY